MSEREFHLAQFNIARMRAPLDDPIMQGFVERIDATNALADQAPGFVWRLQDEAGGATSIRPYEDEMILVNMSVWESLETMWDYVYRSAHREPLRMRKEWFEEIDEATFVLWWIPAGHIPTLEEARERLEQLRRDGPSESAFPVRKPFPAPSVAAAT